MLASSTVYTVVTRLVIRVPSTADDDTGRLHCLPSGFDTVRSTVYTIGPSTTQHGLCDLLSQRGSPWPSGGMGYITVYPVWRHIDRAAYSEPRPMV